MSVVCILIGSFWCAIVYLNNKRKLFIVRQKDFICIYDTVVLKNMFFRIFNPSQCHPTLSNELCWFNVANKLQETVPELYALSSEKFCTTAKNSSRYSLKTDEKTLVT